MAPQLTPVQRQTIIALRESGLRIKDIERRTGITRKTINFWVKRYEETGRDLSAHHRALYQRPTTAEQDAEIVSAHTSNPFLPTQSTASEYSISKDTVRRRLAAGGLKHRIPATKFLLNRALADARISFCLEYYNFDWENNIVILLMKKHLNPTNMAGKYYGGEITKGVR